MRIITLGGGCFWCIEACFKAVPGVKSVKSGYSGGKFDHPTYKEVCHGKTGHAEVVQIKYDSQKVKTKDLLYLFFKMHDPTQLNRQGNDIGTQYRSAIFYHEPDQKKIALAVIEELNSKVFGGGIVTEVTKFEKFWKAEEYHNNYYENNMENPYCRSVVNPKLKKFMQELGK